MVPPATASVELVPRKRLFQVTALAWLAGIAVDLLLGAGLLSGFITWQHPCILPPVKAFQYIPLGYVAFLLWTVLFVWLIARVGATGIRSGVAFAAKLGAVIQGAGCLGMASMLALPPSMLVIWFLDGMAVFCVAGVVIGSGLAASRLRALTFGVGVFVLACAVVAIVMQTLGLAPAGELRR